jgi:hypothetical protein
MRLRVFIFLTLILGASIHTANVFAQANPKFPRRNALILR